MIKELEYIEIYPKIIVYRNVFPDVDDFLKKSLACNGWESWYSFGTMLALQEKDIIFNSFPTKEEYMNSREYCDDPKNRELSILLGEIFYDVTKHYIDKYPDTSFPNWLKRSASVNEYANESGVSPNYAMNYHTDFVWPLRDNPGEKFALTTTFYLNDDYEGGEICFKIKDDLISHKPKKGDVIVFPATRPYLHAVRKNYGGPRYMIRSFWQYKDSGSEEWLANEKKYGEKVWEDMEKERLKKEMNAGQYDAEAFNDIFDRDNEKYL